METEEIIRNVYYDPATGFRGIEGTYKTLKKMGHKISRDEIKNFLDKQEVVQTSRKNVGRLGSFVPPHPLYEFQIDLIYLDDKHLNKAAYGLVCIDTFSKKGDVELLKKKDAASVVEAMQKILDRMGTPKYIYCDEGSEFNNAQFKKLMNDKKIEIIFSLRHATIAERFNRTLKELIHKYLQSTDTKTITTVLPKILHNYNNSYHRTIRMAPNEVNETNKDQVYQNILEHSHRKNYEPIEVGDQVRVQLKRKSHEKGYRPKFSKQVYRVTGIEGRYYIIEGLNRKYLRAFLQKIGEIEKNLSPIDLEGTREGHLKELAERYIEPDSLLEKERLEQEKETHAIAKTKEKRERKVPERYRE